MQQLPDIFLCANCGVLCYLENIAVHIHDFNFCCQECRSGLSGGPFHKNYKKSKKSHIAYNWMKNHIRYNKWKDKVIQLADFKCAISERYDNLEPHCIFKSQKRIDAEELFVIDDSICLCEDVYFSIFKMASNGTKFKQAVAEIQKQLV